ncbi:DUF1570 domain-containing protein [Marinicella sp. W31]|uniref:DUF1570 domain-containing protein n=1 Tax=Marinicella sp. W31 TaxID=3023713 RepID=UPI003756EA87
MRYTAAFIFLSLLFTHPALLAQNLSIDDINNNLSRQDIAHIMPVIDKQLDFHSQHLDFPNKIQVPVHVFEDAKKYRKYRSRISTSSTSNNGFYSGSRKEVIINKNKKYLNTLKHEIQHFLLRSQTKSPPKWINEGLSELYESSEVRGRRVFALKQNKKHERLQKLLDADEIPTLRNWLDISNQNWRKQNKDSAIRINSTLSWGLVYFLMSSEQGQSTLSQTIHDLRISKSKQSAKYLDKNYRGGLSRLQRDFKNFVQILPPEIQL